MMWQGKENCCPYCGASEEKFMEGCCQEAAEALEAEIRGDML